MSAVLVQAALLIRTMSERNDLKEVAHSDKSTEIDSSLLSRSKDSSKPSYFRWLLNASCNQFLPFEDSYLFIFVLLIDFPMFVKHFVLVMLCY